MTRQLLLVGGTIASAGTTTVALLWVIGTTPYSDASLLIEAANTDELLFRAYSTPRYSTS